MNYPDNVSAGDPSAPWNQEDPDPLRCDACDHEPEEGEAQEGDQCSERWDDLKARPQRFGVRCDGRYQSTRCTECGHLNCNCED